MPQVKRHPSIRARLEATLHGDEWEGPDAEGVTLEFPDGFFIWGHVGQDGAIWVLDGNQEHRCQTEAEFVRVATEMASI